MRRQGPEDGARRADESGRRRPVPIEGAIEEIPCDVAISAIGTNANPFAKKIGGKMELNKWGYIVARPRRPARPPIPASGPAATSSPVPLRSFWRWAPAKKAARFHHQEPAGRVTPQH